MAATTETRTYQAMQAMHKDMPHVARMAKKKKKHSKTEQAMMHRPRKKDT